MSRKQEDLITKYSGIAARCTVAAYDPSLTPEQLTAASNNARAADNQVERVRNNNR